MIEEEFKNSELTGKVIGCAMTVGSGVNRGCLSTAEGDSLAHGDVSNSHRESKVIPYFDKFPVRHFVDADAKRHFWVSY